ncbi:MAG: endonuclease NucS [Gammaproteobacteria bacterium]|nr:endonuclease NucS [Gammaproteobacteria bacterium]
MSIYEKSTKELMHEFAAQKLTLGQVFSRKDAVRWFSKHYPNIKSNTVGMHVDGMSVNSPSRRHHSNVKPDAGWDLFFKLGPSEFRLWDSEKDPAPRYKADIEADIAGNVTETGDIAEETTEEDELGSRKFAFERDLQNYLAQNLGLLEPGLKLYEDEDGVFTGIEFPAGQRRIDILAVGTDGAYVVIETKVSRAYDRVVGQILRYMSWIKGNLAGEASVRGIIVASEISEDLILATAFVENIRLVEYEISFSLKPVSGQ